MEKVLPHLYLYQETKKITSKVNHRQTHLSYNLTNRQKEITLTGPTAEDDLNTNYFVDVEKSLKAAMMNLHL